MHRYEIPGTPTAWASHQGYGKKSFNPRYMERQAARWYIKNQHGQRPLYKGAIRADFFFEMPIPNSLGKKLKERVKAGEKIWHTKRPDRSNFVKFIEDCLTGTLWDDDSQVSCGEAQKYYSFEPKTIIFIQELNQKCTHPTNASSNTP